MPRENEPIDPLESYFAAGSLQGLIQSGRALLDARRVRTRDENEEQFHLRAFLHRVLYYLFIVIPAYVLQGFQRLRTSLTGQNGGFSEGAWQFYLMYNLREDLGQFTVESNGYHRDRPEEATALDDLTAWVMTVIQFVWGYEELMGVIWDEWTMLRLVSGAAEENNLLLDPLFQRLQRGWEVVRPYTAPLNGTYADVRRAAFAEYITPKLEALPEAVHKKIIERYEALVATERISFQKQMSLLARIVPSTHIDRRRPIRLWEARIGLVVRGRYYLLPVVAHDDEGHPIVYSMGGARWSLNFVNGEPVDPHGNTLILEGEQLYRVRDREWVGYLDMATASRVKGVLREILNHAEHYAEDATAPVDLLLVETPRRAQSQLRGLLPAETQRDLEALSRASIVINWDTSDSEANLAALRRTQRGIGDHPLTIIRTQNTIVFDLKHAFFDGTHAAAMAEVLTTAAVQWCRRCITISASDAHPRRPLLLQSSRQFRQRAESLREASEVSAETTIFNFISQVAKVRSLLAQKATRLTVNDLLVIARIFHAAHYSPSLEVQEQIDHLRRTGRSSAERRAVKAIARSLERGRVTNPALLIPVDASFHKPQARLYPITFRNLVLADNLVWVWDDTWDAYQEYRKIDQLDPSGTPEGQAALKEFALKRALLIGNLIAFSHVLAANKSVAIRGDSLNVAVLNLLAGLSPVVQRSLNSIPEQIRVLNEVLKGDEVYSNIGRVAPNSSLARFITAKDDGAAKVLAWGMMTDDENRLIVTMRDFRPHVRPLMEAGHLELAHQMAQDYVTSYTADLIGLIARLAAMLQIETTGI